MLRLAPVRPHGRTHGLCSAAVAALHHIIWPAPESMSRSCQQTKPRSHGPIQMALVCSVELAELKRVLTTQMAKLPESRFDDSDAELMRFAIAAGILQVGCRHCSWMLTETWQTGVVLRKTADL